MGSEGLRHIGLFARDGDYGDGMEAVLRAQEIASVE